MLKFNQLRTDQQSCITELYETPAAYVVMRMGGGKTATVLTALSELAIDGHIGKAIVLAPPLVAATVWPEEPAKWVHLKHLKVVALTGGPQAREKLLREGDADVYTASDGVVAWLVKLLLANPELRPDVLVYDEPKLKNPRGAIGKQLRKIAPHLSSVWFLSGTPRPNGYEDLFMPASILKPDLWGTDFDRWRRRNFMQMDYSGYTWEVHDFRARELEADVRTFMVRAAEPRDTREGTLCSGADYDIEIDLPSGARKAYDEMERDLILEVLGAAGPPESDGPAVVAALSQAVASSKLAQIAQGFLYGDPEEGREQITHEMHHAKGDALTYQLDAIGAENTIITYGFREDVARICAVLDKLGRKYGLLGQGTSIKQKMRHVADWNEGRLDNLVLHPASAGHGVELQFGGRRMIHYCPTWSAEQYDQVIKRLDRPGQTRQVYSHQIIARDTVDVIKRNRVEFKMSDQDAFKEMLRTL